MTEAERMREACAKVVEALSADNNAKMTGRGGFVDGILSNICRALDLATSTIRALPLPESELPADVIALVIAAREALESDELSDSAALDKAVEAFASRVCYDDEGGTLPDAHADPCTCGAKGGR